MTRAVLCDHTTPPLHPTRHPPPGTCSYRYRYRYRFPPPVPRPTPQVLLQLGSGFAPPGLRTADRRELYADPARLAAVTTPIFFMCGDRDRMCPPRVSKRKSVSLGCSTYTRRPSLHAAPMCKNGSGIRMSSCSGC